MHNKLTTLNIHFVIIIIITFITEHSKALNTVRTQAHYIAKYS